MKIKRTINNGGHVVLFSSREILDFLRLDLSHAEYPGVLEVLHPGHGGEGDAGVAGLVLPAQLVGETQQPDLGER